MVDIKRGYRGLDNLLSGLEQDILELDRRGLDAETGLFFGRVQGVQDIIESSLRFQFSDDQPYSERWGPLTHTQPETTSYDTPGLPVPSSFREKRKLLAELFAHRPGIPGQLRAAFSASKKLSDSEIDAVVQRLVRLGILCRDNTSDDDDT